MQCGRFPKSLVILASQQRHFGGDIWQHVRQQVFYNLSVVYVTNTLCCLFAAAQVLLLGNPWLIAMAKAKKAAAAEAPAAGASDSDAGKQFQWSI